MSPLRCLSAAALALAVVTVGFAVRDPWFPDGPVQPPIPRGVPLPPITRTLQFPLKTARTLHSDAEIAQARANVKAFPSARAIADKILADAAYWTTWTDDALRDLVTTADVTRAVDLCPDGCPVHGRKIFETSTGTSYPWIVDPHHPFKVKCPIGGETYPDNDYGAYYHSGFKDRSSLTGKIVDDGWGWVAPDGKRYWFVAHANHMLWQRLELDGRSINSAILTLSRAYLLTGDRAYAHRAAVLLQRVAEVYPAMNYEQQSREGQLMGEQGTRYTGKIVNAIWEAYQVVPELAEGYDNIWETIDRDTALQKFSGRTGPQIRASIEANYLEDAIDAYFADQIRGNYGTHQRALLLLAVVRQHGDNRRYVDEVLHRADGHFLRVGFDYALYDLVFRDGAAHESPDYNFVWPRIFAASAELLKKLGYDMSVLPRLHRMFDEPLDFITTGTHSPALGDSKTIDAPLIGDDALVYQRAWRLYGDSRYAAFLAGIGATGDHSFTSYDALFSPALPVAATPTDGRAVPPQPSHVLTGYGYALLNNPADTRSLGLYYGEHLNHFHYDRLHFDLFAYGRPLTPDLGYPDAANEFNPGIFTWSKTTISHNTVTVDARRQNANPAGTLRFFADGPHTRALSVDAPGTYPATTTYRRTLVMVDLPAAAHSPDRGYVVDFFDVAGGHQHDYSLHGPPGEFSVSAETNLTPPAPGTLAGENVALGEIYDDPVLGAKDYKGSYLRYAGSGFQHLFNVQHVQSGSDFTYAQYIDAKNPQARLRIRILPQPGQDIILADAHVSPIKHPALLKYLIARRTGPAGAPLASTFVSVLEPFPDQPFLVSATPAPVAGPAEARAVIVRRAPDAQGGVRDLIVHSAHGPVRVDSAGLPPLETDAEVAVVTLDAAQHPVRVFFAQGTYFRLGALQFSAAPLEGQIVSVNPATNTIGVRINSVAPPDLATLTGRVFAVKNAQHTDAFTIASARIDGRTLVLAIKEDLRVGLARVATATPDQLTTNTPLYLAAVYPGTMLTTRAFQPLGTVTRCQDGVLQLAAPRPAHLPVNPGDDVWLLGVALGDRVTLPTVFNWQQP
ncbi:heparinase II/III-family protein [Horticoccus luteus]|uniref:Heparinase II/III-family protein n=1 Tax=Horticoccus luteus TaxID=2862869 RepID=A0A8F9XL45_9BACT|nr:heparinase II/III family protein [Horticoccus luteus]QYM78684.1 heparinase II/III-family protein [Horticoccus luteus]